MGIPTLGLAVAALCLAAACGAEAPVDFRDDFSAGLAHWVVEKWEDDAVQVAVEDGKLRVSTQSKLHGVMVWLKQELPRDFAFEFDFTPLSQSGFFLLFFCQKGTRGEDILDKALIEDRNHTTLFNKYTKGRSGYHISYRRNEEANCNLRKNPGLRLLKQEQLADVLPKGKTVHVKLAKRGGRITLEVAGKPFMDSADGEKPWEGGRIGLRQVYDSAGLYSNVTLKELR